MKTTLMKSAIACILLYACESHGETIYSSFNGDATLNNPPIVPVFEITQETRVTRITNYHWNGGNGRIAEQINGSIGLRRVVDGVDGDVVGTWPAVTRYSSFGPPAFWDAAPNIVLTPGRYKVIDSDHASWSYTTTDIYGYLGGNGANWQPGIGFSEVIAGELFTLTTSATNGSVTGAGSYLQNSIATLTATPDSGYLFTEWTGDATGGNNPLAVTMDAIKTITAVFSADSRDSDGDGLTNYKEIVVYGSNPEIRDSDGDGFLDGYEVTVRTDPNAASSKPDNQMTIYTAVEVEFGAAVGHTYRVESSIDLQTWTPVEAGIVGSGGAVTRLYSIRAIPKRYFRAVQE